jgi:hypothetical protein
VILYIDPGAGSMLVQAVLAGVLAVPFLFRSRMRAVLSRLRRSKDDPSED